MAYGMLPDDALREVPVKDVQPAAADAGVPLAAAGPP